MNHFLYIESREEENTSLDSKRVLLSEENYKHIISSLDHYPPTADEVKKAICILTGRLIYRSVWNMESDIDSLNMSLSPPKEMTVAEIEKELGHKVKIVKEKNESIFRWNMLWLEVERPATEDVGL